MKLDIKLKVDMLVIGLITALVGQVSGLVINEFMASNSWYCTDEFGEFDDWLELYNNDTLPVDVGGYFLSDNFSKPTKWKIPQTAPYATTIKPGGHLLLWLDDTKSQGVLHAGFCLNASGEQIGLYAPDGHIPIDTITFSSHAENISLGRTTDGAPQWRIFNRPSPRSSNDRADDIPEYYIECDPDSLRYLYTHYTTDHAIPITLTYNNRTWTKVAMRIRGDSSRDLPKKSLRIEFGNKQFIDGSDALLLNADYADMSFMHTVLSSTLMKKSGQTCFNADYARVYCNGTFFGLYITVQGVDDDFLRNNGMDSDGNLYKAYKDGACMSRYDDVAVHWEKKNTTSTGYDDLTALIKEVNDIPDEHYPSFIRRTFDYNELVNLLAMNILLNNGSTYYHNYFLYHDLHRSGKWKMLPWDMDLTFSGYILDLPYHRTSNNWTSDNPLIERCMLDPGILQDIWDRISVLGSSFMNTDSITPIIDSLRTRVLPSVLEDQTDLVASANSFDQHIGFIRQHVTKRLACLQEQLEHWPRSFRITPVPEKRPEGLLFTWQAAVDPDHDPVTYTFKYSTQASLFDSVSTLITGLQDTAFLLNKELSPGDYYWNVTASDGTHYTEGFNSWNRLTLLPGNHNLSLPLYELSIAEKDLAAMNADPYNDTFYTARFIFNDKEYPCVVRYRGATSRDLPKKSFHVKFADRNNPFGVKHCKLSAEYRDQSLLRNFLAMQLCTYLGIPAPSVAHINLWVNNRYFGVYLHVEGIDDDFLRKNSHTTDAMYKAVNHGATMAPICDPVSFNSTWERIEGDDNDHYAMKSFLNQVYYWTDEDFADSIATVCNVSEILAFFAVQLAIVNFDGMTKNMYCGHNTVTNRWELFPWDGDATFGNDYQGVYQPAYESIRHVDRFERHILIQRLLENPETAHQFTTFYETVVKDGFTYLSGVIDSVYRVIQSDIHQDSAKCASNKEFDEAILQLKQFLVNRARVPVDSVFHQRIPITDIRIANAMPTPNNRKVGISVRCKGTQPVFALYTDNIDFNKSGASFTETALQLFDDGQHGDGIAGDHWYANSLDVTAMNRHSIPITFVTGGLFTPPNGLDFINYYPTTTWSCAPQSSDSAAITIGNLYQSAEHYAVTLHNNAATAINLSSACLQTGTYFNIFTLPHDFVLNSNSTVIIAASKSHLPPLFNSIPVIEGFFLRMRKGDTITLCTPGLEKIISKPITMLEPTLPQSKTVMITEINYHSSGNDMQDWVELYNPGTTPVAIGGWRLICQPQELVGIIPANTILKPNSYLILCENAATVRFPNQTVAQFDIVSLGYGLNDTGATLALIDTNDRIVNSLSYQCSAPWPNGTGGTGYTLSLKYGKTDNILPTNWETSKFLGGTPGKPNDVMTGTLPRITCRYGTSEAMVSFTLKEKDHVAIDIFNLKGAKVRTIVNKILKPAVYRYPLKRDMLSPGYYVIRISIRNKVHSISTLMIPN